MDLVIFWVKLKVNLENKINLKSLKTWVNNFFKASPSTLS